MTARIVSLLAWVALLTHVLGIASISRAVAATPATEYRNPILHADYSDPDVIRVGDHYYMVASTFHFSPGLPVLKSRDLVHWTIVAHVLPRLNFHPAYDLPGPLDFDDSTERPRWQTTPGHRYSGGVWAPSIRFHRGRFYVYFATPDEGIFMSSARHAEGPWSPPVKVIDQAGLEDPCPFWDDDGSAYLVHSRVGAGPLILHRMSTDGRTVLDAGKVIAEDAKNLPVLEGPKLLKRDGYYYIFAPYGGVGEGPQAVLRSRDIFGPYEFRTVLSQGATRVQGPHQGGYVETPSGQGWFVHFNQTGGYGRIVHLQPVKWEDGWPVMGERLASAASDGTGMRSSVGQPVDSHAMPDVGGAFPPTFPQTSDEFSDRALGLQWEWNHNPVGSHWSLRERRGFLRLKALGAANLVGARNTLTQVQQWSASEMTVRLSVAQMKDGQKAGLAMFGRQPSWIGVVQRNGMRTLTHSSAGKETGGDVITQPFVLLRMHVRDERVHYSFSLDEGATFREFGPASRMQFSWWKGARPALFTFNIDQNGALNRRAAQDPDRGGVADFDWVRVSPLPLEEKIDRKALVTRHNPVLTRLDPFSPLMVGNGSIAFTADITGLQTFQEQYSSRVPLMIQSQWAWHSFPNPQRFTLENSLRPVEVRGTSRLYPWLRDWSEATAPAITWLRENPHRFSLGRLSLHLRSSRGVEARFEDLSEAHQTLDMWSGTLDSRFVFEGDAVRVQTRVHPDLDMIVVTLSGLALDAGRLGVDLRFPGVSAKLNPDPADWGNPERHSTREVTRNERELSLERQLDDTRYYVTATASRDVSFQRTGAHSFRVLPTDRVPLTGRALPAAPAGSLTLFVNFTERKLTQPPPDAEAAIAAVSEHWRNYWTRGAAVDFSGSTDPRAPELERRVVLSQYLMALNGAGTIPPQEEGLFSNSWNGKFHLEMHPWHSAHFALWGRTELLERSMPWYLQHLPAAKARAESMGLKGAMWPKMVGPEGRESPSTINPFIVWQQPHPILLAELIYRSRSSSATLTRYRDLVFETADVLASLPSFDEQRNAYIIGPPVVPAQEVFPPLTTFNPAFELEYFRFGLRTAQRWRERMGLPRNADWDRVLEKLAPLPQKNGLYLATESFPQLWDEPRGPASKDHPSFLGAMGFLPGTGADPETMRRTLRAVESHWDLRQTWGWDFPLMAMTAARLHEPHKAIDFLLRPEKNNLFGVAGMTPRVHLNTSADEPSRENPSGTNPPLSTPDGPAYRREAETYFPSNGGLLLAIALMAAGWDGETESAPGFPKDGTWRVRTEGLLPLP